MGRFNSFILREYIIYFKKKSNRAFEKRSSVYCPRMACTLHKVRSFSLIKKMHTITESPFQGTFIGEQNKLLLEWLGINAL